MCFDGKKMRAGHLDSMPTPPRAPIHPNPSSNPMNPSTPSYQILVTEHGVKENQTEPMQPFVYSYSIHPPGFKLSKTERINSLLLAKTPRLLLGGESCFQCFAQSHPIPIIAISAAASQVSKPQRIGTS